MATWCFRCDAPVEGEICPTCGKPATRVEDPEDEPEIHVPWWYRIPRRTWVTGAAILVILLYTLFQSGFRLVD